ncbi:SVF1 Survival factor 1 [Candida maltosa Xu316]|uniref:Survival factor 1 n=1 Tax=Candida maltosa (strain Xu316) TaxID=1245528 RepID=M3J3W3_CANMX|nr:Survival factor 1 [Candida maltosa Xu316]
MLKWVQGGLSAVAGFAEPEYGPEAIQPITKRIKSETSVYRSTKAEDFTWLSPNYTNVETQTFYFTDLTTKNVGFAQIIHSNIMGLTVTAQFTFRLFNPENPKEVNLWTSTKLDNFRTDGFNFYADNLSLEMSDNKKYILKSHVTDDSIVEFEMERLTEGVIFGDDGMSYYGEDPEQPWGSMRHVFWPRCKVEGNVITPTKEYQINGFTMFVMALQGMKPHHAAKSWNFINFQSEHYSAIQMEFTTPKSYGSTKVNIGIVCNNEEILYGTIDNQVTHLESEVDEIGWSVPKKIEFDYLNQEGASVAKVNGDLSELIERVDVMAEIPQFVKNIVSGVSGAKPYIYQYSNEFTIEIDGKEEKGLGLTEVTFISE